jgi:hypothetical protein
MPKPLTLGDLFSSTGASPERPCPYCGATRERPGWRDAVYGDDEHGTAFELYVFQEPCFACDPGSVPDADDELVS